MTEELSKLIMAWSIIVVFSLFMFGVLFGFVDVASTEMAKLVGAMFGYLTGLLSMVFAKYFKVVS